MLTSRRLAVALVIVITLTLFACERDPMPERCVFVSVPINPRGILGTLYIADDRRPWIVQLAPLGPHCGGQEDPVGHIITIDDELPPELLDRVVAHELGHVLGAGHVPDANAIMYEDATAPTLDVLARAALARRVPAWNGLTRATKRMTFEPARDDPLFAPDDNAECVRVNSCEVRDHDGP